MTLEEKRDYRNKRCAQFLHKQKASVFVTYFRIDKDYTRMPAYEVDELAEATGIGFNALISDYGFGSAVIPFEVMDHYHAEMGDSVGVGQVQYT